MPKVKIDAKQALTDIRSGMTDFALMDKYKLSSTGLQSLLKKLVDAGILKQAEIDERMPLSQKTVDILLFRCPACGMPQFTEFQDCPQCGIIVSKFMERQAKTIDSGQGLNQGTAVVSTTTIPTDVMFRANLQRTGCFDSKGIRELNELKWKFKTGGWVSASPAITPAGIYFGSLDGNLYLLDTETGQEKWHFEAASSIYSSCAVSDSAVYFGTLDGGLYSVSPSDGKLIYKFATSGPVYSSPAISEGILFFGSLDCNLYAVEHVAEASNGNSKRADPCILPPPLAATLSFWEA